MAGFDLGNRRSDERFGQDGQSDGDLIQAREDVDDALGMVGFGGGHLLVEGLLQVVDRRNRRGGHGSFPRGGWG